MKVCGLRLWIRARGTRGSWIALCVRWRGIGVGIVRSWQEAVSYGVPKVYELGYQDGQPVKVTITLIDANHCPGSTMSVASDTFRSDNQVPHRIGSIRSTAHRRCTSG